MSVNEDQISAIVDKVVASLTGNVQVTVKPQAPVVSSVSNSQSNQSSPVTNLLGCFHDIESAILAAEKAFFEFQKVSVETRKKIIENIRNICRANVKELSKMGHEETGLGRYEDKIAKNMCAIEKTPGVEDLHPTAFTGDGGLTLLELAPYGVIGSITPCTNPSETIINNGIGMIAGGNAVAFNPHPSAKKTSAYTISLLNKATIAAGGPPNLFTTVLNPTIASANILMKHPKIRLLVVTGGPAVVAAAMKSGKRVIGAGPGNPPVVVDETADFDRAGRCIVQSSSTDNNIICVIEKEIIATKPAFEPLKKALIKHGAVEISAYQTKRLEKIILDEHNHPRKEYVGKNIQFILKQIGLDVTEDKRIAIMEVEQDHPFAVHELLMPVIPMIKAKDIDDAIEIAYKLENGCFHTAVIHSSNIDNMDKMAKRMNTSIFVKNGPALAGLGLGGEGPASFTIASPTGEGVTTARHFTRIRRCTLSDYFRIV